MHQSPLRIRRGRRAANVLFAMMGDYGYKAHSADVVYSTRGTFINVAAFARLNGEDDIERPRESHEFRILPFELKSSN